MCRFLMTYEDGAVEFFHQGNFCWVGLAASTELIQFCVRLYFGQSDVIIKRFDTFDMVAACDSILLVVSGCAMRWSAIVGSHGS